MLNFSSGSALPPLTVSDSTEPAVFPGLLMLPFSGAAIALTTTVVSPSVVTTHFMFEGHCLSLGVQPIKYARAYRTFDVYIN